MEKQKTFKTPNKMLARMQVVHFGKVLFNLQFVALAVMAASVLSFIFPAIYYIVLICISLLTLFSIFAWYPNFSSLWTNGEKLGEIALTLAQSWKYTVPIVLGLAIVSIICLCFDNKKHIARIVISSIIAVLAIVALIVKLINGGGAA